MDWLLHEYNKIVCFLPFLCELPVFDLLFLVEVLIGGSHVTAWSFLAIRVLTDFVVLFEADFRLLLEPKALSSAHFLAWEFCVVLLVRAFCILYLKWVRVLECGLWHILNGVFFNENWINIQGFAVNRIRKTSFNPYKLVGLIFVSHRKVIAYFSLYADSLRWFLRWQDTSDFEAFSVELCGLLCKLN